MATIQIVEDNPISRRVVQVALEAAGYRVVQSENAAAAITAFGREQPDLVLQDLILPDLHGLELVARLRAAPRGSKVPILALTGFLDRIEDPRFALFDDVIVKPVEPSKLTDLVRAHVAPDGREPGAGRGRRVLIVHDDALQLRLQRALLRSQGFEVTTARDAASALELAAQARPDAILSDVVMPGTDGLTFTIQARRDPDLAAVPVVLATARTPEAADVELARQMGADALVQRTPDLKEVVDALAAALDTGRRRTRSQPAVVDRDAGEAHRRALMQQLERQAAANQELKQLCTIQGAILTNIASLSGTIARRANLLEALTEVLYTLVDVSGASRAVVYLCDGGSDFHVGAVLGFGDAARVEVERFFGHAEVLRSALEESTLVTFPSEGGTRAAGEHILAAAQAAAAILVPLVARGERIGALFLGSNLVTLHAAQWQSFARVAGAQLGNAIALNATVSQLARSERQWRLLLEAAGEGIFGVDTEGRTTFANAAALRMLGYPADQLVGRVQHELTHHTRCDGSPYPRSACPIYAAFTDGQVRRVSGEVFWRKDGTSFPVEYTSNPVRDDGGAIVGAVVTFADITERERLEQRLRQAQKLEAIGQLTGGVAHDFNNLLTAILGYTELAIRQASADSQLHRDLDQVRQAGQSASALTRQLLAFSRQQVLNPEVIKIGEVVLKVDKLLRRVIGEDIDLQTVLGAGVPPVFADPGQVEQILMNLAVNARDAMPGGGRLTITAARADLAAAVAADGATIPDGAYAALAVSDTGTGMTPEVRVRAFEPFFTTKEVGKGTGLGLSTVYGIVKQSGGHVAVESEVGRGTTFTVYLPPAEAIERDEHVHGERPLARGSGRILLVEDAGLVRELSRDVLRTSGFTVVEASTPEEALRIAGSGVPFDLLLTDFVMPGMNGRELADRLRQAQPGLRVLLMSGYAGAARQQRELLQPGEAFLEKPFMPQDLVERIRELLDGHE